MKNTKKILSVVLIAAFFLTTAAQTDAFAWSFRKNVVNQVTNHVVKPAVNAVKSVFNAVASVIGGVKSIIGAVVGGVGTSLRKIVRLIGRFKEKMKGAGGPMFDRSPIKGKPDLSIKTADAAAKVVEAAGKAVVDLRDSGGLPPKPTPIKGDNEQWARTAGEAAPKAGDAAVKVSEKIKDAAGPVVERGPVKRVSLRLISKGKSAYPPIGGPQGGIAPDVVNPVVQKGAAQPAK